MGFAFPLHLAQSNLSFQILKDTFRNLLSRRVEVSLTTRLAFISGHFPLPTSTGVKVEKDACPVLGWCCPCPCLLTAASSLVMGVLTLRPRCVHLGGLGGVGVSVPATGSPQLPAPVASHPSLAASIWVSSPWGQPCQVGSWKALLALLPSWGPCDSQKPTPS